MKEFNILVLGDFVVGEALETSLGSLAQLIDTSKNDLNIHIIEHQNGIEKLNGALKFYGIQKYCKTILSDDINQIETAYVNADVILLPQKSCKISILKEALSMRIIPICLDFYDTQDYLDKSCSILIANGSKEEIRNEFAETLLMLKEDKEAVELLKQGVVKKYQEAFCWGKINEPKRRRLAS